MKKYFFHELGTLKQINCSGNMNLVIKKAKHVNNMITRRAIMATIGRMNTIDYSFDHKW